MKIASCPRIFSWPTYSASDFGRRARSNASSWGEVGATEIRRSVSMAMVGNHRRSGSFYSRSTLRPGTRLFAAHDRHDLMRDPGPAAIAAGCLGQNLEARELVVRLLFRAYILRPPVAHIVGCY